ncbi:hypothetical protein O9G_005637, partial [Rozella allomycis CSF55]
MRPQPLIHKIRSHEQEVLSVDWNKYNSNLILTASADTSIKLWDMRKLDGPLNVFRFHRYAVNSIQFSPFKENIFASGSYDMSWSVWDLGSNVPLRFDDSFTEFITDVEWNC